MEPSELQTKNGASDVCCKCEYVLNTDELVYTVDRANITQNKILSTVAIAKIHRDTMDGRYSGRGDAREPPLMAPVTDASQYSRVRVDSIMTRTAADVEQWCSFCNDFRDRLLLCAGCRVALCSADVGSTRGCVPWDVCIDSPAFIFICPYCAEINKDVGPSTVCPATRFLKSIVDVPSSTCLEWHGNSRRNGTFHSDMIQPS